LPALLASKEAAWLALVDTFDKSTVALYRRIDDGLRALRVKRLLPVVPR
jgi:hypothetical protein